MISKQYLLGIYKQIHKSKFWAIWESHSHKSSCMCLVFYLEIQEYLYNDFGGKQNCFYLFHTAIKYERDREEKWERLKSE